MISTSWIGVGAFVAGMAALSRFLRRRDAAGDYDTPPSSAASPGLRRLFDYGPQGWRRDGARQRTSSR